MLFYYDYSLRFLKCSVQRWKRQEITNMSHCMVHMLGMVSRVGAIQEETTKCTLYI